MEIVAAWRWLPAGWRQGFNDDQRLMPFQFPRQMRRP